MTLTRTNGLALTLALSFAAAGCGDDNGSDVTTPPSGTVSQEDLVGSWNVTSSQCTSTSAGTVFDLFADGGAGIIEVLVAPNGQYTYTTQWSDPNRDATETSGTIAVGSDGTVTDTRSDGSAGVATSVESSDNGDTLTLTQQSTTFDFDQNPGTPAEPASCVQTWTRSTTTDG